MSPPIINQSLNLQWASTIINTLVNNRMDTFFISPGNRNLPLIAAIVYHPNTIEKTCFDERAAGYKAIGFAKATGKPGVLVCTSGTALANYFPAVIEASRDEIPMIILSADRPLELVESDANQTMDQKGIFDRFCLKSLSLPCPTEDIPAETLISDLEHICNITSGPVHINCPFREPLIPKNWDPEKCLGYDRFYKKTEPVTRYHHPVMIPDHMDMVFNIIQTTKKGLVVVGRLNSTENRDVLTAFIKQIGWPTFCDISSGLKPFVPPSLMIPFFDHPEAVRIISEYAPDTVLQFGTGFVSKHYYQSILSRTIKNRILITPRKGLRDPSRLMDRIVRTNAQSFIEALAGFHPLAHDQNAIGKCVASFNDLIGRMHHATSENILSYPVIAQIIIQLIPDREALFLGNSITIRAFDMEVPCQGKKVHVITNRGVSGIEGHIATSQGYADGKGKRVTAVMGDIAFLHDLNSLMLVRQSTYPVIIILINNQGGRIFERLPVHLYPEITTPNMICPHELQFKHAAAQFDIPYSRVNTPDDLRTRYQEVLEGETSHLIEVCLSPEKDLEIFNNRKNIRLT